MTAVTLAALARRRASATMSISMMESLTGVQVDCTTYASMPRTFSPTSTEISPSEKRPTLMRPRGTSR
jgi:hypothetical protein